MSHKLSSSRDDRESPTNDLRSSPKKTWLFNWIGGGYNTVQAPTRDEALERARAKGRPTRQNSCSLTVDEPTLHEATIDEIRAWDQRYAWLFY